MTNHSSTSSSSWRRWIPWGGVWAALIIAVIHMAFVHILSSNPLLRQDVLQKIDALTANSSPWLILAGDSRAECQLDPEVMAQELSIEESHIANIAVAGGDSHMTLTALQRYRERMASQAVVVLSVSPHHLADRTDYDRYYSADYYWSVGMAERLRHLSPVDAVRAAFIPERAFFEQCFASLTGQVTKPDWTGRGFRALGNEPDESTASGFKGTIERLRRWNCFQVRDRDTVPVRKFVSDIQQIKAMGFRVVLLDAPDHPAMLAALAQETAGRNYCHFRNLLESLAIELNVPLITCDAHDLMEQTEHDDRVVEHVMLDPYFVDGVHLSTNGSRRFSTLMTAELLALHHAGQLALNIPDKALAQAR
ncbi:MAG: hypothetical protein ACPGXK_05005 [Phycisphaerae bacterium]